MKCARPSFLGSWLLTANAKNVEAFSYNEGNRSSTSRFLLYSNISSTKPQSASPERVIKAYCNCLVLRKVKGGIGCTVQYRLGTRFPLRCVAPGVPRLFNPISVVLAIRCPVPESGIRTFPPRGIPRFIFH